MSKCGNEQPFLEGACPFQKKKLYLLSYAHFPPIFNDLARSPNPSLCIWSRGAPRQLKIRSIKMQMKTNRVTTSCYYSRSHGFIRSINAITPIAKSWFMLLFLLPATVSDPLKRA